MVTMEEDGNPDMPHFMGEVTLPAQWVCYTDLLCIFISIMPRLMVKVLRGLMYNNITELLHNKKKGQNRCHVFM